MSLPLAVAVPSAFAAAVFSALALSAPAAPPPIVLDGWNGPLVALGDVGPTTAPFAALGIDDDLAQFARAVHREFPKGNEVFAALLGDPAFVPLAPGPLAAGSTAALGVATAIAGDGRSGSGRLAFSNRSNLFQMAMPGLVSLGGSEWQTLDCATVSPLVLDLAGTGAFEAGGGTWAPHPGNAFAPFAPFDIDGDGFRDIAEWLPPGLAFVTTTPRPRSGRDLVGSPGGWRDGFEKLLRRDRDGDGLVAGAELAGLHAWADEDLDGVADDGEVTPLAELGVQWIATTHAALAGTFSIATSGLPPQERTCWDFWPSFMRVNLLPPAGSDPPPPAPRACSAGRCPSWMRELVPALQAAEPGQGRPARPAASDWLSPDELAAAGIDVASFDLLAVERGARLVVGTDLVGVPRRARLVVLDRGNGRTRFAALPFASIQQAKLSPLGDRAFVIGDEGARLALVLLPSGRVVPDGGLDLLPLGLRAAGVAGWTDRPWMLAWRIDGDGAAHELRTWSLGPRGFEPGLSMDDLADELGPIRSHVVVSPVEVVVATETSTGTQQLWRALGTERTLLAEADAFGGIAAVPAAAAWCRRNGAAFSVERWDAEHGWRPVAGGPDPLFYPFLAREDAPVVFASLDSAARALRLHVEAPASADLGDPILVTVPGQTKVGVGALAHHAPDGVRIVPLPAW